MAAEEQERSSRVAAAEAAIMQGVGTLRALALIPLPGLPSPAPVGKPEASKPDALKPPRDNYGRCADFTLKYEGLYSNHPNDKGGPTMRGVTMAVFKAWRRDDNLTIEDLKALTDIEARQIYRTNYWNVVKGDELPIGIDLCLFDIAINSGVGRAGQCVQEVLGFTGRDVDRAIGPKTLRAILAVNNRAAFIDDLIFWRLAFLKKLGNWDDFGAGWTTRVNACNKLAQDMLSKV